MASLKALAQCLGLPASFSVVSDFLGHQSLPEDSSYSLRNQIALVRTAHVHINLILVGDNLDESTIDSAVFRMRKIYAKVNLGVGRVLWRFVPAAMAEGHDIIDSDEEAGLLTNSWTVHNNAVDVFVIRNGWTEDGSIRGGISAVNGSCDKDNDKSYTGSIISLMGINTGGVMAHEVGHYLGLEHVDGLSAEDVLDPEASAGITMEQRSNLMFPVALALNPNLRPEQGDIMKRHCFIQPGC